MNSMTMPGKSKAQFIQTEIEKVFQKLVSPDIELKNFYETYLLEEYGTSSEDRISYYDIGRIADFIKEKYKLRQTQNFETIFNNIEDILQNCDQYVSELIVIGLFEDIQNICSTEINYYTGFDKWLKPVSKKSWDELIDFWEGKEWRNKQ